MEIQYETMYILFVLCLSLFLYLSFLFCLLRLFLSRFFSLLRVLPQGFDGRPKAPPPPPENVRLLSDLGLTPSPL